MAEYEIGDQFFGMAFTATITEKRVNDGIIYYLVTFQLNGDWNQSGWDLWIRGSDLFRANGDSRVI